MEWGIGSDRWRKPAAGSRRLCVRLLTAAAAVGCASCSGPAVHPAQHETGANTAKASGEATPRAPDEATSSQPDAEPRPIRILRHDGLPVQSVAFTSDGRLLASGGDSGTVEIWEVKSGKQQRILFPCADEPDWGPIRPGRAGKGMIRIFACTGAISSVAFSPDGSRLAAAGGDGRVWVWELASGKKLGTLVLEPGLVVDGQVFRVAFSPDGRKLAAANRSKITFWAADTHEKLNARWGSAQYGLVWAGDASATFEAGASSLDRVDAKSGKRAWQDRTSSVQAVALSPDEQTLALVAQGDTVIMDAATGNFRARIAAKEWTKAVAFTPDGKLLVGATSDDTWLYDATTLQEVGRLRNSATSGNAVHRNTAALAVAADGTIAVGDARGRIQLWDLAEKKPGRTLSGHYAPVSAVELAPDGASLASAGADNRLRIWSLDGRLRSTLRTSYWSAAGIGFLDGGATIVAGGSGTVFGWKVATGEVVHDESYSTGATSSLSVHPDDKSFVIGQNGAGAVEVIRLGSAAERVSRYDYLGTAVAFSRDGRWLVAGGQEGEAVVWAVPDPGRNGRRNWGWDRKSAKMIVKGHTGPVTAVDMTPSGDVLATGGFDGKLRLWNRENNAEMLNAKAHAGGVTVVLFGPAGKWLFTGGADGDVKVWPIAKPGEPRTLAAHRWRVSDLALSSDGALLVTSGLDGEVRLWDLAALGVRIGDGGGAAVAAKPATVEPKLDDAQRETVRMARAALERKARGKQAIFRLWQADLAHIRLAGAPIPYKGKSVVVFRTVFPKSTVLDYSKRVFDYFLVHVARKKGKQVATEVRALQVGARIKGVDFTYEGWALAILDGQLVGVGDGITAGRLLLTELGPDQGEIREGCARLEGEVVEEHHNHASAHVSRELCVRGGRVTLGAERTDAGDDDGGGMR